jgi:hypothetical protein
MSYFDSARNVAHILLSKYKPKPTQDEIAKELENVFLMPDFKEVDREELLAQLASDFGIYSKEATMLVEEDVLPWLDDRKSSIDWQLWNRYRTFVKDKDASFPVDSLDDITHKILDKCVNPKAEGRWDRRGMVVGNVQSGKTANYVGLINKATDAGYKLIIVIAGIHNTLRKQTQARVDEGYIGRSSSDFLQLGKNKRIGVGKYECSTEIYPFTSAAQNGDFKRQVATTLRNVPIGGLSPTVLVIKKNKSILENLILWLNEFAIEIDGERKILNVPLLVIDDEADNASVNSGTELDVRAINRLIRTLLNLFNKNTFIGYTATPYANLFIPSTWSEELTTEVKGVKLKVGEDLFPRDFIVNIPPPSNYIGAAQLFGYEEAETGRVFEGLDIVRPAEDQEPYFPRTISRENKDLLPDDVPETLRTAIKSFILTCAVRRLRGQGKKHSSMLVHVALRVNWIDRVAWLVNEILRDYQRQIRSGQGPLLGELHALYEEDFVPTSIEVLQNLAYKDPKVKPHKWEEVEPHVFPAADKITVRAVHGLKNTRGLEYHSIEELDYEPFDDIGLSVIAVGGNKLSRGITLEGLSVSYYLRTARLYDSLMQMGRWFGYRPGYVDLCRLYTTDQLVTWYRHVTMATEEMRDDFDLMARENKRPKDYQLKVRTSPGMLAITSAGRMKEVETIRLAYSGALKQTYDFSPAQSDADLNYKAFTRLLGKLKSPETERNLLFRGVDANSVCDFISECVSFDYLSPDAIVGYIKKQNEQHRLTEWNVAVILSTAKKQRAEGIDGEDSLNHEFTWSDGDCDGFLPGRYLRREGGRLVVPDSKNAILDKSARIVDLGLKTSDKEDEIKKKRRELGIPLLVIMPLDPRISKTLIREDVPLIGYGIQFPEIEGEVRYEYAARPLRADFDDAPDESDDPADQEDES